MNAGVVPPRKAGGIGLCLGLLFLLVVPVFAAARVVPCFPLDRGTYWIYEGDVSWVEGNSSKGPTTIRQAHFFYRCEVEATVRKGKLFAAKSRGSPFDFNGYQPGKTPAECLIYRVGSGSYFLYRGENIATVWTEISRSGERAIRALSSGDQLIPMPLKATLRSGEPEPRFERCVEKLGMFDLGTVAGSPRLRDPRIYSLTLRENTDLSCYEFVPGLGITFSGYHHNGTVAEFSIRLVRFGRK